MLEVNNFEALKISLASPEKIRSWSYGGIMATATIVNIAGKILMIFPLSFFIQPFSSIQKRAPENSGAVM